MIQKLFAAKDVGKAKLFKSAYDRGVSFQTEFKTDDGLYARLDAFENMRDGKTALYEIKSGCLHNKVVCGGERASVEEPEFYWVNTILGNLKSALRNTYHAIRPKYAQRYLSEFQYRFNRRFDLCQLIPRLTYAALRTPPMPEKLLKLSLA